MEFSPDYSMPKAWAIAKSRAFVRGYEIYTARLKSERGNNMPWEARVTDVNAELYKMLDEFYPTYSVRSHRTQIYKWLEGTRTPKDEVLRALSGLFYGQDNEDFIFLDAYKDMREYYDGVFGAYAKRSVYLTRQVNKLAKEKEQIDSGLLAGFSEADVEEWEF